MLKLKEWTVASNTEGVTERGTKGARTSRVTRLVGKKVKITALCLTRSTSWGITIYKERGKRIISEGQGEQDWRDGRLVTSFTYVFILDGPDS